MGKHALQGIGIGVGLFFLLALFLAAGTGPGVVHAGNLGRPVAVTGGPIFVKQEGGLPIGDGCGTQDKPCRYVWQAMSLVTTTRNTMYISSGTYYGIGRAVITVTQNLTVCGGWNGSSTGSIVCDPVAYRTVLDGEGARRVIYVSHPSDAKVDGLTIARGWAGAGSLHAGNGGGGVYVDVASITLSRDVIMGNTSASYGGGLYGDLSVTLITACQVLSNSAQYGGGGHALQAASSGCRTASSSRTRPAMRPRWTLPARSHLSRAT